MRQVGDYRLWIGSALSAEDLRNLHQVGIEALVDLGLNEPVAKASRELIYCRFPLIDGEGNSAFLLRMAVETVSKLIGAGVPTLVFCSAGMSRSPAVSAAALAQVTGRPPDECLAFVFGDGPRDLSIGLWKDLLNVIR